MLWSAGNKKKISWQFYWLIRSAADDKWQIGLGPSAVQQSPEFCKQLKVQPSSLNHINCQVTDTSHELGGWSYSKSEIAGAGKDLQRLLLSQFILDTGKLRPRFPKGTWDPDAARPTHVPPMPPPILLHRPTSQAALPLPTFPLHACPALQRRRRELLRLCVRLESCVFQPWCASYRVQFPKISRRELSTHSQDIFPSAKEGFLHPVLFFCVFLCDLQRW